MRSTYRYIQSTEDSLWRLAQAELLPRPPALVQSEAVELTESESDEAQEYGVGDKP